MPNQFKTVQKSQMAKSSQMEMDTSTDTPMEKSQMARAFMSRFIHLKQVIPRQDNECLLKTVININF